MGEFTNDIDPDSPSDRAGDSPAVIARIVAAAHGRCACCHGEVYGDFNRMVHTVSAEDMAEERDWPALVCERCQGAMRDGGFTSVVDFVFSRRPACPACGVRRSREISYGMPTYEWFSTMAPWEASGGCCVGPAEWSCGGCGHQWGSRAMPWER